MMCMFVTNSAQEMAALFPDRVIAIRGGIDNISQAETAISSKLAECIEHEMQQGMGMVCICAPFYDQKRVSLLLIVNRSHK